jgi:hypothetical protein
MPFIFLYLLSPKAIIPYMRLHKIDFPIGYKISKKYKILEKIGGGWEGEVYIIKELGTNIDRAAKFFYPQRNKNNKTAKRYAKKLHKLRSAPVIIQYYGLETIEYEDLEINYLVSEYVEGETLSKFLKKQKGGRLTLFEALNLLHKLASGLEDIHNMYEYHGDLHLDNVIIRRHGIGFDVKLIDMFHWKDATSTNIRHDIYDMIRLFYDCLGGKKFYSTSSPIVKEICCGLKRPAIFKKFRSAADIKWHLENLEWHESI